MDRREKLLLDFFTEIAVVEHLVRNYAQQIDTLDLTAGQFGALNFFIRNGRDQERKSVIAWLFQVSEPEMDVHLNALESAGCIARRHENGEEIILLTDAGRDAHARALGAMAADMEPLLAEFADEDIEKSLTVLQEVRRTFDNLPGR